MRVLHVVSGISRESSGLAQSVPTLCRAEASLGASISLVSVASTGERRAADIDARTFPRTRIPGFRFADWSAPLLAHVLGAARDYDLIHVHSLWNFPDIYPGWVHALTGIPIVTSPHGTLCDWGLKRSPRKKAVSLALGQRYSLRRSAFLHATCDAEADEIRAFGLQNRIIVVPNGMAFAPPRTEVERDPHRVLFLSRLHPKKSIDRLLDAWKIIENKSTELELIIAGPSEGGHGEQMERYALQLGLRRVSFVGELLGEAKRALYASTSVFVLPSENENFGMVVIEALAEGALVVASRGTPWAELERERIGRWVENAPETLAEAILSLVFLPIADAAPARERAKSWVRDRYDSRHSARLLIDAYESVVRARRRPGS